ncbi:MAG: gluconate:H+ symporter [Alphaproteobacteria bacterium]|nr:gluconate:H+ symporter [Alphaproteobacteria bacterium]
MLILSIVLAVAVLVILIAVLKVHPFIAFIISALSAALLLHMPLARIPGSIEHGIGDMLGSLAVIICLGAMFGKLIADSGAAQQIARVLMKGFGSRRITLAMTFTGFIVGIPLFYNVGFVLLVPLVFSVAYRSRLSAVYLGIPLLAGLSIAHGFLPPHPSPVALVTQFGANMGLTLLYGAIVGVPTLLIAGPLLASTLKRVASVPNDLFKPADIPDDRLPGAFNAFACALLPVVLIGLTTALSFAGKTDPALKPVIGFAGDPMLVMLLSLAVATITLGLMRGVPLTRLMNSYGKSIRDIATILLIVAGAGALKQVFVDTGVDAQLGVLLAKLPIPPLALGWLVAMVIRIALGSATVAGLTAASIVAPVVAATGADRNLMVLAVGAGSLMCSHVNDSGFWMFKEYFNVSLWDTFRSWTLMETLVGTFGLVFVLILSLWV